MSALPKVSADHISAIQHRMDQLFKLWRTTTNLENRDIVRLNELLARCTADELKQAAMFLEGLVEWRTGTAG
jgi:hypothetical protein